MFELSDTGVLSAAKIKVIGIGGAGGNAVSTMIPTTFGGSISSWLIPMHRRWEHRPRRSRSNSAPRSPRGWAPVRIPISATGRDGEPGADPGEARGRRHGFHHPGLGGGTGTGGAPIVAEIARELGALTVAIVTKPFPVRGEAPQRPGRGGYRRTSQEGGHLIIVPTNGSSAWAAATFRSSRRLRRPTTSSTTPLKGSRFDHGPGLDQPRLRRRQDHHGGYGHGPDGTGTASGENRAVEAAQRAISSPLLEDNTIQGARGVLLNITGGLNMTLYEIHEASSLIQSEAHEDANIIFGTSSTKRWATRSGSPSSRPV